MADFQPSPTASQEELPLQPEPRLISEPPTLPSPISRPSSPKRRRVDLDSDEVERQLSTLSQEPWNGAKDELHSSEDEMNLGSSSRGHEPSGSASGTGKGKGKGKEVAPQSPQQEEPLLVLDSDDEDDGIIEIMEADTSNDIDGSSMATSRSQSKRIGKMKQTNPSKSPPPSSPPPDGPSPASLYTCPICFSPPTSSVLTPCGHIMCGSCLFPSIAAAQQRSRGMGLGAAAIAEAKCPVCRANIPGWDGRGGGVVGLEMRVVYTV